jgi:hypothetical protein
VADRRRCAEYAAVAKGRADRAYLPSPRCAMVVTDARGSTASRWRSFDWTMVVGVRHAVAAVRVTSRIDHDLITIGRRDS